MTPPLPRRKPLRRRPPAAPAAQPPVVVPYILAEGQPVRVDPQAVPLLWDLADSGEVVQVRAPAGLVGLLLHDGSSTLGGGGLPCG